jgi:hypothetical protein
MITTDELIDAVIQYRHRDRGALPRRIELATDVYDMLRSDAAATGFPLDHMPAPPAEYLMGIPITENPGLPHGTWRVIPGEQP